MLALALALSQIGLDPAAAAAAAKPETAVYRASLPTEASQPLSGVRVVLECVAFRDGHVGGCVVLQETRPGLGFGPAAVALMNGSPVEPGMVAGQPADVKFQHTIAFTP